MQAGHPMTGDPISEETRRARSDDLKRYRDFLAKHFPEADLDQVQWLEYATIVAIDLKSPGHFIRPKEEEKLIDDFIRHLRAALRAVSSLHRAVRYELGRDAKDPFATTRHHFTKELVLMLYGLTGEFEAGWLVRDEGTAKNYPRKKGSRALAHALLRELNDGTKMSSATYSKIEFMKTADSIWERYSGEAAPEKTTSGPFINFLSDFITLVGKENEWDADNLMRTNRNFRKSKKFPVKDIHIRNLSKE